MTHHYNWHRQHTEELNSLSVIYYCSDPVLTTVKSYPSASASTSIIPDPSGGASVTSHSTGAHWGQILRSSGPFAIFITQVLTILRSTKRN